MFDSLRDLAKLTNDKAYQKNQFFKFKNYFLDFVLFGYSPERVQRVLNAATDKPEPDELLRSESR